MAEKTDEVAELLEMAKYREIAANAFYVAGVSRTDDPGAKQLMRELADEEAGHYRALSDYRDHPEHGGRLAGVKDLMQGDYLTGGATLEGAGLQDTLIFSIKREQASVDFYTRLTGVMTTPAGKELCQRLAAQELRHKVRLELLYENLFLKED
jgi:rubrerythrin